MVSKRLQSRPDGEGQSLKELKVEYLPLDALKANEYNANRQSDHEFELLLRSIKEDGFTQPVLAMMDGTIIDGEHRWRAAHALNMETIPVVRIDMTEAQRRIATLRHNMARGSHDIELVGNIVKDLEQLGAINWAQDALMLDDKELDRLLKDIQAPEELGKDQDWSEAWEPTKIDEHRIREGAVSKAAETAEYLRKDPVKLAREREEKQINQADQQKALRTVSINFVFTSAQWGIIQQVLGVNRAEGLYKLCEKYLQES
ncbi:MAG TPA: ParB/RepB/Spo0J family partition protein [Spirochaetia bacterium]|nr:ParB/RepB/Spo0J family partition protein [Spirochaetia bacterium]